MKTNKNSTEQEKLVKDLLEAGEEVPEYLTYVCPHLCPPDVDAEWEHIQKLIKERDNVIT